MKEETLQLIPQNYKNHKRLLSKIIANELNNPGEKE